MKAPRIAIILIRLNIERDEFQISFWVLKRAPTSTPKIFSNDFPFKIHSFSDIPERLYFSLEIPLSYFFLSSAVIHSFKKKRINLMNNFADVYSI